MKIPAWLSNGEKIILDTLVDTGAEVNLVRMGLMPDHLFFSASKKLKLLTANGSRLSGGERIIETDVAFTQVVNGVRQPTKWWCYAQFYEADIKVDAILSYQWMVDNEIGVLPYRQALVIEQPRLTHLFGLDEIKEIKKRNSAEISCVNLDTNVAVTSDKKAEELSQVMPEPMQKHKEKRRQKGKTKKRRNFCKL
jgi:hypothetical protein